MQINAIPREWLYPGSLEVATKLQLQLAQQVITTDQLPDNIQYIAGMDVSSNWRDPKQIIYATCVVLDAKTLRVVTSASAHMQQKFPYIPGFLGFREAPALVEAFAQLSLKPDLILVDGHGISHPRKLGIASHIGVLLDIPTIGVAKSILIGKPAGTLDLAADATMPLLWQEQTIAMLLRSKNRCNPLIIATGHKIALPTAVKLVKSYLRGYRLPEPTRQAHLAANAYRRKLHD
ncbi:MAG: nfi [Gammaproteobacteria bacterium]|jgi:deoxyribonuclease V|nr:nfi [Gammaproteobacteria bacterium]